jgi:hypothetical protein
MEQSHEKVSLLRKRLSTEKAREVFSPEEQKALGEEIDQYLSLERKVAESRQRLNDDFEKARTMDDKQVRLAYLDSLKGKREENREKELAERTGMCFRYSLSLLLLTLSLNSIFVLDLDLCL